MLQFTRALAPRILRIALPTGANLATAEPTSWKCGLRRASGRRHLIKPSWRRVCPRCSARWSRRSACPSKTTRKSRRQDQLLCQRQGLDTAPRAARIVPRSRLPRTDPWAVASPDGRWLAFLDNGNLWIRSADGKTRFALTTDATPHNGYARSGRIHRRRSGDGAAARALAVKDGHALPGPPGPPPKPIVLWSPDSKYLFTHRLDQRDVREITLTQSTPTDGSVRPISNHWGYAMPNDAAVPQMEPWIFDLANRTGRAVAAAVAMLVLDADRGRRCLVVARQRARIPDCPLPLCQEHELECHRSHRAVHRGNSCRKPAIRMWNRRVWANLPWSMSSRIMMSCGFPNATASVIFISMTAPPAV